MGFGYLLAQGVFDGFILSRRSVSCVVPQATVCGRWYVHCGAKPIVELAWPVESGI